jgi:hypothetical protein
MNGTIKVNFKPAVYFLAPAAPYLVKVIVSKKKRTSDI